MPTLPHKMVVSRKFESCLNLETLIARGFSLFDSISRRSFVILKKARLRPENIADCDMQKIIPNHTKVVFIFFSNQLFFGKDTINQDYDRIIL
jgi:hypothetical protein